MQLSLYCTFIVNSTYSTTFYQNVSILLIDSMIALGLSIKDVRSKGGGKVAKYGNFSDKGRGSIFRDFVQRLSWKAPYLKL